jgi:hypothetical protein
MSATSVGIFYLFGAQPLDEPHFYFLLFDEFPRACRVSFDRDLAFKLCQGVDS